MDRSRKEFPSRLRAVELPSDDLNAAVDRVAPGPPMKRYAVGNSKVMVSHDDQVWHLSIVHRSGWPSMEEIEAARYQLVPDDVWMAIVFPPPGVWAGSRRIVHLYQVRDPALEERLSPRRRGHAN